MRQCLRLFYFLNFLYQKIIFQNIGRAQRGSQGMGAGGAPRGRGSSFSGPRGAGRGRGGGRGSVPRGMPYRG